MGYADIFLKKKRGEDQKFASESQGEKPFRNLINPTQGKPGDRWRVGSLFYKLLNVIPWERYRGTELMESEKKEIWNDFLTTSGGLEEAIRIFPEFVFRLYSDRFNATQNRLKAIKSLSERLQIPLTGESLLWAYKRLTKRLRVIEKNLKSTENEEREAWKLERESTFISLECYRKYRNMEELKCR